MSELPPPPPPPPGAPPGGGATGATKSAGTDLDWERVREFAERCYRPLVEPACWYALLYLFAGMLWSIVAFVALSIVGWTTFGLMFAVVGFLLVVPAFLFVEQLTRVERWLASLAGHAIEPREPRPREPFGFAAFRRFVSDPVRWRHVGFVAANVFIAPILFAFGWFPASIVMRTVFDTPWVGVFWWPITLPLAAVALAALPRTAIFMADVKARIDTWFLGTDRLAVAEQRVSDLSVQRQDILDAVAGERRRIERNLHDGVQQQLVAIGLDLGMAEHQLARDPDTARELIVSARSKVQDSITELRRLGRGLHPSILEDRGIDAALSAVVSGSSIPISALVDPDLDLPPDVAETVYFIVNEAIANVLKHADATVASVHVSKVGPNVRMTVHDNGIGGVDPALGTGIAGIRARVYALDGTFNVTSPIGGPTTLVAEIPSGSQV